MSPNKRIFLNIVATYGRSLYALAIGLFTARWALMSLGVVDYGLYGVVGGLTGFVAFFNTIMAGSVGRFYAFSVGGMRKNKTGENGLEDCRQWFNLAVSIHTVLPLILIIVGWPIGEWAVHDFLTIPPNRVSACIWVWRAACLSCFVGMVNVPFQAMYTARQEIAELTIYSFFTTTFNALFLYYMVSHPGDWLVRYGLWMCLVSVVPQLLICFRACVVYPECKFRAAYMWNRKRFAELMNYASARFWGALSTLIVSHGTSVLVNKLLGPAANAAMSVGNSVVSHSLTLSQSFSGAMWPAVVNAAGSNDHNRMLNLSYAACKFGAILVLIFAIPLSLEANYIMKLWLKTPPDGAASLCMIILYVLAVDKMTDGLWMSIFAKGKIMAYEVTIGIAGFSIFVITWLFIGFGYGVVAYGIARAIGKIPSIILRLHFAKKQAGVSPKLWIRSIAIPILWITVGSVVAGLALKGVMSPSLARVACTTVLSELIFIPLVWCFVLTVENRAFVRERIERVMVKFRRNVENKGATA